MSNQVVLISSTETALKPTSIFTQILKKIWKWPIRWDPLSQSAIMDTSLASKLVQGFHFGLSVIHSGFCALQMISITQSESSSQSEIVYIQLITILTLIPVLIRIVLFFNGNDVAACMNLGCPFFKHYERKNGKKSRIARKLPLLLKFIYYAMNTNTLLLLLVMLARPESPDWITSKLPSEELRKSFTLKILVLPFYLTLFNGVRFEVVMVSCFIFFTAVWAQEVLRDLSERVANESDARAMREDLTVYSQMRIIMRIFDRATYIMIPAVKLVVIIPATFSLYALVKLEGLLSLFCVLYALDTTFLLELLLGILAQPYEHSFSFLQRLKVNGGSRGRLMKRYVRAMKPIGVTVSGGMYFVDKMLMLTVLEIIVTNAINVLIVSG